VESDSDRGEVDVVVLDDTDMSEGESTGEESRSRSSFDGSSFDSGRSRTNWKRAAKNSPDRDYDSPTRQAFPGVVSRGTSGCRIYVPTTGIFENKARGYATSTNEIASSADQTTITTVTEEPIVAACASTRVADEGGSVEMTPGAPESTVSEPITAGEANTVAITIGETTAIQNERNDGESNVEAALSQVTTTNIAIRDAIEARVVKVDSQTSARTLVGCANLDPFVAVNAVFNVPAQMLRSSNEHAAANVRDITPEEQRVIIARTRDAIVATTASTTSNKWGRHGYIIAEIHRVLATMEPLWGSLQVFEAVSRRFPEVDETALQMTVLAVLMTQRNCVRKLTLAGARKGPRRDENGEVFIELDLVYENRFSDSY